MKITKEILIEKVNSNDTDWFEKLFYGEVDNETKKEYSIVYNMNYGDGNDWLVTIEFKNLKMFVSLNGTYSSWDSAYWDSVSFSQPYEHTEIRYKPVTLQYIRDQKIKEVLDEGDESE
jgi:hypothetical protein